MPKIPETGPFTHNKPALRANVIPGGVFLHYGGFGMVLTEGIRAGSMGRVEVFVAA